jgi:Flp pilus assembly protein TadD
MSARIATAVSTNRRLVTLAAFAAALLTSQGPASAQQDCGDGRDGLKVDYIDPSTTAQALVNNMNNNHFNENVRNLKGGQTGTLAGDLDYILRNSPNHHKALYTMSEYHLRERTERFEHEAFTMTCWFERAMRFSPNDPVVPMLYGIYLHRRGDFGEAEREYKRSMEMSPDFAEVHYNLGLLYLDRKRLDDARTQAREAYRLGYPLPGLRDKLAAAGAWTQPGQ